MAAGRLDAFAVRLLEGLGRRLWGFPPRLMPLLVQQLGAVPAVAWFVANMPRYERTLRALGPVRTHLVATTVSLHNGCHYCAFGHAYALELLYFRERGVPFPADAHAVSAWGGLGPAELRERLRALLQDAGLHREVLWVDRTLAMAGGAQRPMDADESRIAHLVRMFEVLNAVGIACSPQLDQAHDPINKDTALKRDLERVRAAAA
jgi:hypothetical protein